MGLQWTKSKSSKLANTLNNIQYNTLSLPFSCSVVILFLFDLRTHDVRPYRWVTGMTRPIKDENSRKDDFTPVTNPSNAHVIDEHKIAIQYLQ